RDGAEMPFRHMVPDEDQVDYGPNWLFEQCDTALERLERRRSRSHVLGLMQRCLEVCEDDRFIKEATLNLAMWARQSGDAFAVQKAEQALDQMDMLPGDSETQDHPVGGRS